MESERRLSAWSEDRLLGAWECFKGDGVHGWESKVLVFRREGGQVVLEYWLPKDETPDAPLRLRGDCRGDCRPTEFGLRLRLRCGLVSGAWRAGGADQWDRVIEIRPDEGET